MIRVLLAEDQAMVRGALAALLGMEPDISVLDSVADGEAAWRELQRLKPDLLVTDIEMPGLTGLELAQRSRHRPGTGPRGVVRGRSPQRPRAPGAAAGR
jgi:two-component system response regulator DesR